MFEKNPFYISKRIQEHNGKKTLGLKIQTIELQKYIFLGNIKYIQNIKIYILVCVLKQSSPIFNILLIKINFKYVIHP